MLLWRAIRWVLVTLTIMLALWLAALISYVYSIPKEATKDANTTDAIVVLTGGSLRIAYGFELLDKGRAKKLFVSGVAEDASLEELMVTHRASQKVRAMAAKEPVIILDRVANSTRSNAAQTAQWVREQGIKSIRLVTANYHMRRSVMEFRRLMPDVTIIADPVFPENFHIEGWWRDEVSRELALSEFHKFMVVLFWPSITS